MFSRLWSNQGAALNRPPALRLMFFSFFMFPLRSPTAYGAVSELDR
jgi:hypothetical protein